MRKKYDKSTVIIKIIGVVSLITSGTFGYVFLRVAPKLIEWISYFTFKDSIKFFFGVLGEIFLGLYTLIGLFLGLTLLVDINELIEEDTKYIQEHNKEE